VECDESPPLPPVDDELSVDFAAMDAVEGTLDTSSIVVEASAPSTKTSPAVLDSQSSAPSVTPVAPAPPVKNQPVNQSQNRGALLADIQKSKTLKKVEQVPKEDNKDQGNTDNSNIESSLVAALGSMRGAIAGVNLDASDDEKSRSSDNSSWSS
ncbi:MAG: hypothetical protein KDH94_06600, partial [Coxiellaceae bacterium]|nr:hypothetical protein [Coxiellaceae bacterium]